MSRPRLAVVIVSFERGELTRRCIESLRRETTCNYHLFLTDNGSRGEATHVLLDQWERDPGITLTRLPENTGPSTGRNHGLRRIDGSFSHIAMLDNDIVALAGWDRAAIEALNGEFDLIQPKLLEADLQRVERGPNEERPGGMDANPRFIGRGAARYASEVSRRGPCEIVGSGVMRREVLESVGKLDDRLQIGEDFDYSFRARALGFRLGYVPECELIHDHGFEFSYDQERARVEKYLWAHLILWQKHRKALLSPAYLCWYSWLYFHDEAMYLPPGSRLRNLPQRLHRRWGRWRCMSRHQNFWRDRPAIEVATAELGLRLGSADGQ